MTRQEKAYLASQEKAYLASEGRGMTRQEKADHAKTKRTSAIVRRFHGTPGLRVPRCCWEDYRATMVEFFHCDGPTLDAMMRIGLFDCSGGTIHWNGGN
jgi:hypothetical protein